MLANENHSKAEVENMLKLKTPIQKKNRKNLERQAVQLFKTKSRGGAFCKRFMALAFEDVMKKEPFCSDAELLIEFQHQIL